MEAAQRRLLFKRPSVDTSNGAVSGWNYGVERCLVGGTLCLTGHSTCVHLPTVSMCISTICRLKAPLNVA